VSAVGIAIVVVTALPNATIEQRAGSLSARGVIGIGAGGRCVVQDRRGFKREQDKSRKVRCGRS